MKLIIVVALALVALSSAATVPGTVLEVAKILRSEFNQNPEGGYNFGFETENGINREETGVVKEVLDEEKKPHQVVVVRGSYTYINDEGKPETIEYIADENGYQAVGPSVPKPVSRR